MIKKFLIKTINLVPKSWVWKVAKTYIAGKDIKSVIETIKELKKKDIVTTVDVLGEYITDLSQAEETKNEYLKLVSTMYKEQGANYISVKPSAFGLLLDQEQCYKNIKEVVEKIKEVDGFVRLDMEDSASVDMELKLYYRLLDEYPKHIGIVIQAYLYRSFDDIKKFVEDYPEPYKINIRLCKGIYKEPKHIAYRRREINPNFIKLLDFMLEKKIYSGVATHDEKLVNASYDLIKKHNTPIDKFEFQMLYGVLPKLRDSIIKKGYKLRLYIPYGKDWFGYSVRRMVENPNVAMKVTKAIFTKG